MKSFSRKREDLYPHRNTFLLSVLFMFLAHPIVSEATCTPPYDATKFRAVLDDSKLQRHGSKTVVACGGDYSDYCKYPNFTLDSGTYMQFYQHESGKRTELRQCDEWNVESSSSKKLNANVKVFQGLSGIKEFTYAQIHEAGGTGPMVRMAWHNSKYGYTDYLFAAVRTRPGTSVTHYPIAPRLSGFFDLELNVQNSRLIIKYNGITKVDVGVSAYNGKNMYFKAGVYNQSKGAAKVQFNTLSYTN
jgi:hypothetical protein